MTHPPEPTALHLGSYARCLDGDGRLLLARMGTGADRGRWTLPGGGVEPGEHPDATLVRELTEETGLAAATLGPVLGVYSRVYDRPGRSVHHVGLVYDVVVEQGPLVHEVGGSTDRCGWFGRDEAAVLALVPLGEFGVGLAWPG